jgi:endonuclease YncB( thermonuclease family)
MKELFFYIWFLSILFPSLTFAEWEARVVHVFDGDTLITSVGGRAEIIELSGVDCPEKKQPFGFEAKDFTSAMVQGKIIKVVPVQNSRHEMFKVYVGDKSLNEELLKAGFAWCKIADSSDEKLVKMEESARQDRKGLWSKDNPVPPWVFRGETDKDAKRSQSYTIKWGTRHEAFSSPQVIQRPTRQPSQRRSTRKK